MTIQELVTKMGFEVDMHPLHKLDEALEALKLGLLELAITAGGAVETLYEMAHTTAETREQMLLLSEQAGMGVTEFSRMAYAARLAGMSTEEFGGSFQILNRHLFEAQQGLQSGVQGFLRMGISMEQLRAVGFNTSAVIQLISHKLESMPSGFKKSGMAIEAFGRSGAKMIPFLNRLHEFEGVAGKLGLEVDPEQAKQSEEFLVSFREWGLVMKSIKDEVGGALIPAFTQLLKRMSEWMMANRKILQTNILGFCKALVSYLGTMSIIAERVATAFMDLAKVLGGVETATKLVLYSMMALGGTAVLLGIGKAVQGAFELAFALTAVDFAAAAIPIAIGAAVVLLALLAEDLYSYFTGKDSLFAGVMEIDKKVGRWITDHFTNFMNTLGGWLGAIADWFASATMKLLSPLMTAMDWIKENEAWLQGKIGGGVNAALSLVGLAPQNAPAGALAGAGAGAGGGNVTVQVDAPVNVPPGTSPQHVPQAIKEGVSDGLQTAIRTARRHLVGGKTD